MHLALSTSSYRSRAEKVAAVPTAAAAEAAEAVEALRAGVGAAQARLYAALLQISISSLQMSISWAWVARRRLR